MYNRYVGNTGKFYRVDEDPVESPHIVEIAPEPRADDGRRTRQKPPPSGGGLGNILGSFLPSRSAVSDKIGSFLPFGLDIGDILILLILLFLYIESGDEEFLIILLILGFTFFTSRK